MADEEIEEAAMQIARLSTNQVENESNVQRPLPLIEMSMFGPSPPPGSAFWHFYRLPQELQDKIVRIRLSFCVVQPHSDCSLVPLSSCH